MYHTYVVTSITTLNIARTRSCTKNVILDIFLIHSHNKASEKVGKYHFGGIFTITSQYVCPNYSTLHSTRDFVRYEVEKTYGTTHNTQCEHNPLPSLCLHSTPPPSAHPIGMNF